MTSSTADSFASVLGFERGTGSESDPQPPDPLTEFLRWLDDETSHRAVKWEELEGSLKNHGFALDEPALLLGRLRRQRRNYPCALWKCRHGKREAELVGFLVVATGTGIRHGWLTAVRQVGGAQAREADPEGRTRSYETGTSFDIYAERASKRAERGGGRVCLTALNAAYLRLVNAGQLGELCLREVLRAALLPELAGE